MMFPNENFLKAVSWTLVHSLWQGIILAVLAGLVILSTKKSSANLRYNLLSGLFLSFIVAVGFTFNCEYQTEIATVSPTNKKVENAIVETQILAETNSEASNYFQMGIDYLNANSKTIVLIWFLIFSLKCFGIFKNLSHVYRIRNYRTQTPPDFWDNRMQELSQLLNIKKKIILLESSLVKVPSVTGIFKPIILLPVGLLANLPHDQIEAILLHELAHIRRKDYFINLVQSFAEILFFFNPGVLWVSSIIKEERENCCDDIAVGVTKSKSKFINALVSFQEYNMKQEKIALGFAGRKNQLLERAKRIVYSHNKSLSNIEKTFLSICIIMVAMVTVACSGAKAQEQKPEPMSQKDIQTLLDLGLEKEMEATDFRRETELEAMEEAEHDKMTAENDRLEAEADELAAEGDRLAAEGEELAAEGERLAAEGERLAAEGEKLAREGAEMDAEMKKEMEKMQREATRMQIEAEKFSREAQKMALASIDHKKISEDAIKAAEKAVRESKDLSEEVKREVEKALTSVKADLDQARAELTVRKKVDELKNSGMVEKMKKDVERARLEQEKARLSAQKHLKEAEKARKSGEESQQATQKIIKKMLADKLITSSKNLSYKISDKEFYVNDKKMSEQQRKEYAKLLPKNITSAYYNYNMEKGNKSSIMFNE